MTATIGNRYGRQSDNREVLFDGSAFSSDKTTGRFVVDKGPAGAWRPFGKIAWRSMVNESINLLDRRSLMDGCKLLWRIRAE